jgi:hypothetical protein
MKPWRSILPRPRRVPVVWNMIWSLFRRHRCSFLIPLSVCSPFDSARSATSPSVPQLQGVRWKAFVYSGDARGKRSILSADLNWASRMTTTIIVVALCSMLLALGRLLPVGKSRIIADRSPCKSLNQLMLGLQEICRSILDPKALTFLRANAPAYAISSYRARQQQLAQLSLRVASDTVLHSIARGSSSDCALSIRNAAKSSISKTKAEACCSSLPRRACRTPHFPVLEIWNSSGSSLCLDTRRKR